MSGLRLEIGEPCVIYRGTRHDRRASLKTDTIAKVGKRDVVTASGERFNRSRLRRSNGEWSTPTELLSPDDPRVVQAVKANAVAREVSRLNEVLDAARKSLRANDIAGCLLILRQVTDAPTSVSAK